MTPLVSGSVTGTFRATTGGGLASNGSATGQIVTIRNNTKASGTQVTTTTSNSTATAAMSDSYSSGGATAHFGASSSANGNFHSPDQGRKVEATPEWVPRDDAIARIRKRPPVGKGHSGRCCRKSAHEVIARWRPRD